MSLTAEVERPSQADGLDILDVVRQAERWFEQSLHQTRRQESVRMAGLARLIENPSAKELSLVITDRIERCQEASRAAAVWREWLRRYRYGKGFALSDRLLFQLGAFGSWIVPGVVMEAVKRRLRSESCDVVLAAEREALANYLSKRRAQGGRVNVNLLGEAVLGEDEAARRLEGLCDLLERDDVDYVSVKISAIFSQINLLAWDQTLDEIKNRLRRLYRGAQAGGKFVNLDMEEYRDLELTLCAFREVLSEPEFHQFSAGVVLQAYLPDSIEAQEKLTAWARERCRRGGAPIKVRLVKGANLAMEKVEAELHGWHVAPFGSKHETDAAFKRMLEFACQPEHAAAVRVGVGTHNLFDCALVAALRDLHGVGEFVEIEMLEGMAPAQARVVEQATGPLLYYAPIVAEKDYGCALAYLVRRLDENTSPGNFLASLFSMKPGSKAWQEQCQCFVAAWEGRHEVSPHSRRQSLPQRGTPGSFANEPDSDWTQATHRERLKKAWRTPDKSVPPGAGRREIERALEEARVAQGDWEARGEKERARILEAVADRLAAVRFQSVALIADEGKKAAAEADTEVSEAIDFARYYAVTGADLAPSLMAKALGTLVVAPPWNFPFAIPCGGVLAALMAGNAVVLKPAPESTRIGWWLVRQLWAAGIPREVLSFVACADGAIGRSLIEDDRVDAVILTGAFETARRFQKWRPSLKLFAETSGKNAIVVSAMADRELAARDLVRSAFAHSGQKCSASSLGILEAEVYDDPVFRRQLRDAAASLPVGPASDPSSVITPLVPLPNESLLRALTTLEEGESWLLEPQVSNEDPCLWSPGIRLGVRKGSWFHVSECFGPVLGLMRAENLDQATAIQNGVPFGLTAGLHTLDESEITLWRERVQAGNLYINRGITGAIVRRQPFGGWKRSSIGPGAKAGGPNYVNLFRILNDGDTVATDGVRRSYESAWRDHFSMEHDPIGLRCEGNVFRYRKRRGVLLRLEQVSEEVEQRARLASQICEVSLIISRASEESVDALLSRLPSLQSEVDCLRTPGVGLPEDEVLRAVADLEWSWIDAPLSAEGRVELTHWMREQTVTEIRHRYGNLMKGTDDLG